MSENGQVEKLNMEMIAFIRKLNTEEAKVETVVAALRKEEARHRNTSQDLALSANTRVEMFLSNVYDLLWVDMETLRQRRINGELDDYFGFNAKVD